MKKLTAILLATAVTAASAQDDQTLLALSGATVHPVEGDPIENGTVLIEGRDITAVGAGIEIPAGAR